VKAPSNRVLAVLFIVILAVSVVNTVLIVFNNDALQKQRNQDLVNVADLQQAITQNISDLNSDISKVNQNVTNLTTEMNQNYTALNESQYVMEALLTGQIDNLNARMPIDQYDYVVYCVQGSGGAVYLAKSGEDGAVVFNSTDAAWLFEQVFSDGNSVYVKSGEYDVVSDIHLSDKVNARLDSDGAVLNLNGNRIWVFGGNWTQSKNNQISGLIIINGTVRVENSFRTVLTNMIFENSTVAIELVNTNTWTEATKIDTVHFDKCLQGIVFRTNTSSTPNACTGSYGSTQTNGCYFNQINNSVAFTVEPNAEWTDGQMQNVRLWAGEYGDFNQTGLLLMANSSMYQTRLDGVVFESFAKGDLVNSQLYAIKIDSVVYGTPILGAGVTFLGGWTTRINNVSGNWIVSSGSVFKQENVPVAVGSMDYGAVTAVQRHPEVISSFKPKIVVQGNFSQNETLTVRFRIEYIDNTVTRDAYSVQKTFNCSGSVWLSDDDLLQLYPPESVIWAIMVDAKANVPLTEATVQVSVYGTTG
jgi:hypothetical protein